ncbi:bacteriocin immunity protein [Pseudomonas sp. GD03858]|uniref:bacteriocin immunity protein n=1 Tax=unclassified Pseudomonas TaxID=196821 RepID=UPI00244C9582|nr:MULTISPECIES: bacteriocin immunity protein [unclassified Pseudomonas]MDH0649169.1 bacteriocin immunity protein [Pseudomonas sp. GD03867]MDH0665337.1 bacteriocin immunity protein [Pseudomonas sp. GD03858]
MIFKDKFEDYTEAEFLTLLNTLFDEHPDLDGPTQERLTNKVVSHFERVTEHPDRSDVIFYPPEGAVDSPEGILQRVKQWRAANGKPGFKPA